MFSCLDYVEKRKEYLKAEVAGFEKRKPSLSVIQIGNDKASTSYINNKKKLCEEILKTPELEFLETSCFYILQNCDEMKKMRKEKKVCHSILECHFDIRERMSYQIEKKALNNINKYTENNKNFTKEIMEPPQFENSGNLNNGGVSVFALNVENTKGVTQEELSNFLSQKITEFFENAPVVSESNKDEDSIYIVRKIFKGAEDQNVVLKACKTKEEAEKFVEQIKQNFPELLKTCTFSISKGYRVD